QVSREFRDETGTPAAVLPSVAAARRAGAVVPGAVDVAAVVAAGELHALHETVALVEGGVVPEIAEVPALDRRLGSLVVDDGFSVVAREHRCGGCRGRDRHAGERCFE